MRRRKIQIDDNRFLVLDINDDFVHTITISEYYLENNELVKTLYLSMWDDFAFNVYIDDYKINEVTFNFDLQHPLYKSLKNLLRNDKELIIDDDLTLEDKMKYLSISYDNDLINLKFINKLSNPEYHSQKFNIFIKNIMIDGRSKIDRQYLDTKQRLCDFFKEIVTNNNLINKQYVLKKGAENE